MRRHLFLAAGLFLSFCTLGETAGTDARRPGAREARIRRIEEGLLPSILVKGRPAMRLTDRMRYYQVSAVSVAVIDHGRIDWVRAYGTLEADGQAPVTPTTPFQAGSISKSVAAFGILRLVREGRLSLDEDVNRWLRSWQVPENEFTREQKVTLRRLLSHTAGLTVHGFPGYEAGTPVPTLLQVLNGVKPANTAPIRVDLVPGSRMRYSGGGYCVAQLLAEDVTGTSFAEYQQKTVLRPLGMRHSTFAQPLPAGLRAPTGYYPDGKPVRGRYHTYPEMAAAGLWTTPTDLARFAIEVQRGAHGKSSRVLTPALVREMLTPQMDGYGLGVALEGKGEAERFSHGGVDEGFEASLVAYRRTGQGAVVMVNSNNGTRLAGEILRSIAREYSWPDYLPAVLEPVSARPTVVAEYVGEYDVDPAVARGIVVTVSLRDGRLFLSVAGQPENEMIPVSDTAFIFGDNARVTFVRGDDEKVAELVLKYGSREIHSRRRAARP